MACFSKYYPTIPQNILGEKKTPVKTDCNLIQIQTTYPCSASLEHFRYKKLLGAR